MSIIGPFAIFM